MNPIIAAEKIIELVWGTKDFPVDPVTIAKKLGLRVLETDLPENVSGALIKAAGKDPAIVVHYADSDNRKRFTCAHELGHYVSRMASQNKENSYEYIDLRSHEASSGENEDEKFANNFAANLLMPENIVSKMSSRGSNRIEMALHFGVSNEALKYRLMNLKLFHEESFV